MGRIDAMKQALTVYGMDLNDAQVRSITLNMGLYVWSTHFPPTSIHPPLSHYYCIIIRSSIISTNSSIMVHPLALPPPLPTVLTMF